jgi:TRAP-type C4-dicarboxylate transport system substrate-binding protein
MRAPAFFLACVLTSAAVHADTTVLRIASVAPDGTSFSREIRAFGREVQAATNDELQIKWYLGGIAGDEIASHLRVQRDQLDGVVSGGMLCQRLAPTMRGAGLVGEFRDRHEADFVINRLRPAIDAEMLKAGYVMVGPAGMGFSVIFSKTPVRTMADLRRLRPWLWSLDDGLHQQLPAMGLHPVSLPVEDAGHAWDDGRTDGFVAVPSAALAFQWSAQARYVIDLRVAYLTGCLLVSRRAWDSLSDEQHQIVQSAVGKLQQRVEDVSTQIDHQLLSGLFAKQGLTALPVPPQLQVEFSDLAARTLPIVEKLAPPGTVQKVRELVNEYRQQNEGAVRR